MAGRHHLRLQRKDALQRLDPAPTVARDLVGVAQVRQGTDEEVAGEDDAVVGQVYYGGVVGLAAAVEELEPAAASKPAGTRL